MKLSLIALLLVLAPTLSLAQSAPELPPLPPLPDAASAPPSPAPEGLPALDPIAPINVGEATQGVITNPPASDLPTLEKEEDFIFFQPEPVLNPANPLEAPPQPPVAEAPPPPVKTDTRSARDFWARPYSKRFNYQTQHLPLAIYNKTYSEGNQHLPVAQFESDYDRAAFVAAARNDVNALRALIDYRGRPLSLRNAAGETLVQVAARYRAHATLRYLLAKGAPRGEVQAQDGISHYTLAAGRQ